MIAKELMIGDLVFIDHCSNRLEPCFGQVKGIDKNGEDVYTTDGMVDISLLKPIPLTDAILKANGFNREGCASYWHEGGRDACVIHWSNDKEQLVIGSPCDDCMVKMNVRYVHELQHAFRLTGIDKEVVL